MRSVIKPWAKKAFELLFHAEHHWRRGMDYDKRLALISFDNSIEVSISIYLSLDPIQRNNKHYQRKDVETWLSNYHSRLDFFSNELSDRKLPEHRDKAHIIYLHKQRNELYHGSSGSVPEISVLDEIRFVALWIYSVLFEDADIERRLDEAIKSIDKAEPVAPFIEEIKPTMADLSRVADTTEKLEALVAATLVGKWDEGTPADLDILKRLSDAI